MISVVAFVYISESFFCFEFFMIVYFSFILASECVLFVICRERMY